MRYIYFVALAVFLAALEMALILTGVVAPLAHKSTGNMFFSLVQILVIASVGWTFAKEGLKKAAIKGGVLMLACVIVLCLAVLMGVILKRPVLGMSATTIQLAVVLILTSAVNIVIGVFIATGAAWLAAKIKK